MTGNSAKQMAVGGVFAALAIVIMTFGGMLPGVTYVCPMVCALILQIVRRICGRRVAWAWYGAVAILSVLLCPDKEASTVFVFFGYYPIVKPWLDQRRGKWLWKLSFFNVSVLVMYWMLMNLMGMGELTEEFREMGMVLIVITLLLGNVVFLFLDRILEGKIRRRRRG